MRSPRMLYKTGAMIAALSILLALLTFVRSSPLRAQTPDPIVEEERHSTYIIRHLGVDGDTDRYEFTLRPGATLFEIATESLPMLAAKDALDLIEQGYMAAYPNRNPNQIAIGDTFSIQVPQGTFVSRTADY